MSITFKTFTNLVAEGKQVYSSESYWKGDAEEKGYKVKKLSGELMKGNQTWGAFDDQDKKVGEFTEEEEGRGGWLMEAKINELFGIFRNNERAEQAKAARDQLKKDTADKVAAHRAKQAKKNGQSKGDDEEEDDDKNLSLADKKKKQMSQTRSMSTTGTRSTQSASGGRAAERDWLDNM